MSEFMSFLLNPNRRNEWLKIGSYQVYVRKGFHRVHGETINTFDVANVENTNLKSRGKGGFKQLLTDLEMLLEADILYRGQIKGIYVESVLNERLGESLVKRGYQELPTVPPSYYYPLRGV